MDQYFEDFFDKQESVKKRYTDPINLENSVADDRDLMPHQEKAILSLKKYYEINDAEVGPQNGMLVMPTGSGKTFTAVKWLLDEGVRNGYRIVWLVHRQELVDQAYSSFYDQVPALKHYGIKKIRVIPVSGAAANVVYARRGDINIVSINSIANKHGFRHIAGMLGENGKKKLIVVVDEAHHAASPSYQKVLKRIHALNPNRILLGLTATPVRAQKADLYVLQKTFNIKENIENKRGTPNGYIEEFSLREMIVAGMLSKPAYIRRDTDIIGDVEFDLTEDDDAYFRRFGELSEEIKFKIAQCSSRNKFILNEYLKNKDKYGKTLIFAVNQLHCKTLHKEFLEAGIKCEYCISDEPGSQDVIRRFKNNEFYVLINVMILTEGSDVPDIQTVFLTRQTNSDSLLMQMIGRGLRGPAAGGTEEAFIVSFHDTWNRFSFWLDPSTVITDGEETAKEDEPSDEKEPVEFKPEEADGRRGTQEDPPVDPGLTEWDLYSRIYSRMRSNITSKMYEDIFLVGWYSVIDENGDDKKVLVFENQLSGFEQIADDSKRILSSKPSAQTVLRRCFDLEENLPELKDIQMILEMLFENKEMPTYYTFEQRDLVDAASIAKEMNQRFDKEDDKDNWLKERFDEVPLLKEIYKNFYVFRRTVFDARKEKVDAMIEVDTVREKLEIDINRFDLDSMLDELIATYSFINRSTLRSIRWSHRINKTWFGLCRRFPNEDGTYECDVLINPVLAASVSDSEIIKYTIYHEMIHAMGIWPHSDNFREWEWKYPNSAELGERTDELLAYFDFDKKSFGAIPKDKQSTIKKDKKNGQIDTADSAATDNSVSAEQANQNLICSFCSAELPPNSLFCNMCGKKVEER